MSGARLPQSELLTTRVAFTLTRTPLTRHQIAARFCLSAHGVNSVLRGLSVIGTIEKVEDAGDGPFHYRFVGRA